MIPLPNVTLVSYVLSEDRDFYERTDRVLKKIAWEYEK